MEKNLIKQVNSLKLAVAGLILINSFLIFSSFDERRNNKFEVLDAERINIIGENGKPVMVISSKKHIPGVVMNGKTYPPQFSDGRDSYTGIIFYNEQGDEVGGLIYNGFPKKDSGYFAIEHLSFDQWKQNQVVALQYLDNGKSRRAGLRVYDRPNVPMDEIFDRYVARNKTTKGTPAYDSIVKEIQASKSRGDDGVERMFIGSLNEEAQIQLRDKKGNIRARFFVDKAGEAKIEFLDGKGNVKKIFPE